MQLTLECRQQQTQKRGGGGGGEEELFDRGRQTALTETFKAEFTYSGVRPLCLIAICCTEKERKKAAEGEEAAAVAAAKRGKNQTLNTIVRL